MDHILYLIFKITLNIYLKSMGKTVNPWIRIYTNKIESRIMFKIKTGYYFKLLTLETIYLLGHIKSKIKKDKNGENGLI